MKALFKKRLCGFGALLFVACLCISTALSVAAQRNPVYTSIEAQVAQADGVYVGTISQLNLRAPNENGDHVATLTVDATETLKGIRRKHFKVFVYGGYDVNTIKIWSQKHTPLLWFPRKTGTEDNSDSPIKSCAFLTINPADWVSPLPLVGYFSMEFRLIRSPRQILNIARRYAKTATQAPKLHSLRYMPDLVHRLFPYNAGGELIVPVGQELERVARRMILSPGSILPMEREIKGIAHADYLASKATDEGSLRRIGVEALAHFKSDANIELLKRCLGDPFLESRWNYDTNVYSVRKLAFNALLKWGVKVTEPQLHPLIGLSEPTK